MIVDGSVRKCTGVVEQCPGTFTMRDYPPGYFSYKYQLKRGYGANTCPRCEAEVLEHFIRQGREDRPAAVRAREDIELLLTGRVRTERHRKQASHTHS